MNEPRRLNRSGGASQRLLDSASLDKPSQAARRNFVTMAATASSFGRTSSRNSGVTELGPRRAHPAKTLATWIAVGAAASVTLGLISSKLLDSGATSNAAAPLATLSAAPTPAEPARSPDIAAEPARPSPASLDEARKIEAARAAVARGDTGGAIAQLNDYDSTHPNGQLKPDALALRIQVLSNTGKATEARALANEFQAKYPAHPLGGQVRGWVSQ